MGISSFFSSLFGGKSKKADKNSITVDSVSQDYPLEFDGNKTYWFTKDCIVYVKGSRYTKSDKTTRKFLMTCTFKKGFMTDGASAPDIFGCVVPHIKEGNDTYNAAPFIHDGLYILRGEIDGANLNREECDDILRGIWRCANMSRVIAGIADVGIHLVAGSSKHWGDDALDCKHLFKAKFKYQ